MKGTRAMKEELESLPLGFRFRPTDEELINHYLKSKISGAGSPDVHVIPEVDVTRCEPWDLPGRSLIKSDDQEWFFFAPKDRKYPNGHRSNRATAAGYWKATGKDRIIRSRSREGNQIIIVGIKKTLVFHRGRAPHGIRTGWIMHEYRTTEPEFESGSQGGYVLYRLFNKEEERASVKDENETGEITSSSAGERPIEAQPTEDLKEFQCMPRPSCVDKCLADLTNSSVASSIVIPSTSDQGLKEFREDGLMQLPKLQVDEVYAFPNVTSPLRPYTDHPFPNSLNQEDYMKLLHANGFSNSELVGNLLDMMLPNPDNYSDTNQQDADSNEAMCWPYEQLENEDADYPNVETNNLTTTIEDTGITILDRAMNLPTAEIPGPQPEPLQGNAKRRVRLLINEFCGSSCMISKRNENKVLQNAGGNGSLAGKHEGLSISGTDSAEIGGVKAEVILRDKLISKGNRQPKGFLWTCTIGKSVQFALCVILIFVCFGLWRKSAGGIRW